MMPANRKKRAFFRWRSADRADSALASIGRFRTGRSDIHGMHAKIARAMSGNRVSATAQHAIFRKQGRGA